MHCQRVSSVLDALNHAWHYSLNSTPYSDTCLEQNNNRDDDQASEIKYLLTFTTIIAIITRRIRNLSSHRSQWSCPFGLNSIELCYFVVWGDIKWKEREPTMQKKPQGSCARIKSRIKSLTLLHFRCNNNGDEMFRSAPLMKLDSDEAEMFDRIGGWRESRFGWDIDCDGFGPDYGAHSKHF